MEHQYPRVSCQILKAFPGELKVFTTIVCISQKIFIPLYWNNEITIIIWWSAGETNEHSHNMIFLAPCVFFVALKHTPARPSPFWNTGCRQDLNFLSLNALQTSEKPKIYTLSYVWRNNSTITSRWSVGPKDKSRDNKTVTLRDSPCEEKFDNSIIRDLRDSPCDWKY